MFASTCENRLLPTVRRLYDLSGALGYRKRSILVITLLVLALLSKRPYLQCIPYVSSSLNSYTYSKALCSNLLASLGKSQHLSAWSQGLYLWANSFLSECTLEKYKLTLFIETVH